MSIPFHPLADLFPLMAGEEFDELVADIKRNELYEKIVLYRGKILDGRNRFNALAKLGISPDRDDKTYFKNVIYAHSTGGEITSRGTDDAAALAYVISKNIHRRHLTAEQKRDLIAKLLKAAPEKSNRQVAKVAKVDDKTVGAVRRELKSTAEIPQLEKPSVPTAKHARSLPRTFAPMTLRLPPRGERPNSLRLSRTILKCLPPRKWRRATSRPMRESAATRSNSRLVPRSPSL